MREDKGLSIPTFDLKPEPTIDEPIRAIDEVSDAVIKTAKTVLWHVGSPFFKKEIIDINSYKKAEQVIAEAIEAAAALYLKAQQAAIEARAAAEKNGNLASIAASIERFADIADDYATETKKNAKTLWERLKEAGHDFVERLKEIDKWGKDQKETTEKTDKALDHEINHLHDP